MANNVVTLDVDWASKSGMADATIGFGETFDLVINGVDTLFSTIRLVLLSQSVSDETAILWTFLPETYEWTEGTVTIRNVRIYTQQVLDMLKSQGGKAKLYLSVASQTGDNSQAEDNHFVDYGVSKVTLTIGSYLGDQPIPPSTEISDITIGELKGYVEQMLAQIRALDKDVKDAVSAANASAERAKGYADEANGVREVAMKASQDAGEAKQKAEVAEQVAKGAQYAKVFATEAEMKAWATAEMAKAEGQREVKVGDNLYIEELEVPDYWWTGEGHGYAQLETGAVKMTVEQELNESTNPVSAKAVYDNVGNVVRYFDVDTDTEIGDKHGKAIVVADNNGQGGIIVGGSRTFKPSWNKWMAQLNYDKIRAYVDKNGTIEDYSFVPGNENQITRKKDLSAVAACVKCVESSVSSLDDTVTNLCSRVYSLERSSGGGGSPGGDSAFVYADMFAATEQVDNYEKVPAEVGACSHLGQTVIGYGAYSDGENNVVLGQCSVADGNNNIIIGNYVKLYCNGRVYIGTDANMIGAGLISYIDNYCGSDFYKDNGAIMFTTCRASVFFASDAYGATVIGGKMRNGCYSAKALEDIFNGSGGGGGDSYIKASTSGSPYDIPGCSSGIAIGPNACIGNDVTNGLAIGIGVEATSNTPVRIGSGCAAITVNSNYELCVGGNPVGGGGSSNDSICVYDSEGYCAVGIGADYVAIGNKSIAYTDSVAVGASSYANNGEVAIGYGAGNDAVVNGFIANNALYNVRRFRACTNCTSGNELFFATKEDKAVLGGEFGRTMNELGDTVPSLCYFYLQDVANMLAKGDGKAGAEVVEGSTYGDGIAFYPSGWSIDENGLSVFLDKDESGNTLPPTFMVNTGGSGEARKSWTGSFASYAELSSVAADVKTMKEKVPEFARLTGGGVRFNTYGSSSANAFEVVPEDTGFSVLIPTSLTTGARKYVYDTTKINELVSGLEARIAALETQLAAATAILESNLCVSGVEPIANENGTEVNYSQNPTGLLEGDELL